MPSFQWERFGREILLLWLNAKKLAAKGLLLRRARACQHNRNPSTISTKLRKPKNITSSFSNLKKNSSVAHYSAKEPLDLIAPFVHLAVVFPWLQARTQRRYNWHITQIQRQLPGLIAFVSTIHQPVNRMLHWPKAFKQRTASRCITNIAGR
jgi:hypothetical protein